MKKLIIIITITLLNIILLFKINILQKAYKQTRIKNIDLITELQKHKEYIKANIKDISIDYYTVYKSIKQKQQIKDTVWVLLVPSDVCMACASSLFAELHNLKIRNELLYLITEQPFEKLKREWYAYKYKNYLIDQTKSIFKNNNFNSKIIILKLINKNRQLHSFIYDPELYDFLNLFML